MWVAIYTHIYAIFHLQGWKFTVNFCYFPSVQNSPDGATLLWPPFVIGGPLYFCTVVSFYLSIFLFFPRLISAATDWMSTILLHMAWP